MSRKLTCHTAMPCAPFGVSHLTAAIGRHKVSVNLLGRPTDAPRKSTKIKSARHSGDSTSWANVRVIVGKNRLAHMDAGNHGSFFGRRQQSCNPGSIEAYRPSKITV